jgi:hypothetical protein
MASYGHRYAILAPHATTSTATSGEVPAAAAAAADDRDVDLTSASHNESPAGGKGVYPVGNAVDYNGRLCAAGRRDVSGQRACWHA